jgi:hypothetical protein
LLLLFCFVWGFCFFFLWYYGSNSGLTPWATPPVIFCHGCFLDRILRTICLGLASNHDPPDLCLLRR